MHCGFEGRLFELLCRWEQLSLHINGVSGRGLEGPCDDLCCPFLDPGYGRDHGFTSASFVPSERVLCRIAV